MTVYKVYLVADAEVLRLGRARRGEGGRHFEAMPVRIFNVGL